MRAAGTRPPLRVVEVKATAVGHGLHVLPGALVLGSAGLLVGAHLDFGPMGLATLADLCSVELPSGLDTLRYRATSAPWTCAGMLAGCNLAMLPSARTAWRAQGAVSVQVVRFAACNAGMILGMWLAEALLAAPSLVGWGIPATARMLLLMVPGMVAGMIAGGWCAERVLRARRRRLADFAVQNAVPRQPESRRGRATIGL